MSASYCEKVARQNVYEKSLPDEAAEKWVRRAFATDCLLAGCDLIGTDAGQMQEPRPKETRTKEA